MLLTYLRRDYLQTRLTRLDPASAPAMADGFAAIERQAVEDYGQGEVGFEHFLDMRYIGQEHTVKIAVARGADGAIDIDATRESFHSAHEKRFPYRHIGRASGRERGCQ